jgi:diacylglycerol O-acyltransferase
MHRLNAVDAQWLVSDDGRQHTHVSMVTLLEGTAADGTPMTLDRIRDLLEQRIHLMPVFRWRLREVPLNLDYPLLVEDPEFDLDEHLWEVAVPKPGTNEQLEDLVSQVHSRPLDLTRPLWELHLIHGLEGGRVAVLTKVHHAAVDGVNGIELLGTMLDPTPEGRPIEPPRESAPEREPSDVELALRGVAALPRQAYRAARATPRTLRNMDQAFLRNMPGTEPASSAARRLYDVFTSGRDGEILSQPAGQAPHIRMGGPVSPHRAWAFTTQDLATVKAIRAKYPGTTVNDVLVAICAGAMRRRLQARGELPSDPLIAANILYVGSSATGRGNHISIMFTELPTNEPDPKVRLTRSHERMAEVKSMHKAVPAPVLMEAAATTPPVMLSGAARTLAVLAASGMVRPSHNVVISNLPGPQVPLFMAGARVLGQYPVNLVMDGMAASFTILSYNGSLDIGITTDRHNAPDVRELAGDFVDELQLLAQVVGVAED